MLDSSVEWAEAAAEAAAGDGEDGDVRRRLEEEAEKARRFHDEFIRTRGFLNVLPGQGGLILTV